MKLKAMSAIASIVLVVGLWPGAACAESGASGGMDVDTGIDLAAGEVVPGDLESGDDGASRFAMPFDEETPADEALVEGDSGFSEGECGLEAQALDPQAAPAWKRLAGDTRYDTMSKIVSEGFKRSEWAVVATGDNFPDALAASALAGAKGCPVILTDGKALSPQASTKLKGLGVKRAYIMGGTGAVSAKVEEAVRALGVKTTRVSGSSRQATSIAAMRAVKGQSETVIIATGNGFADTLSIAPWSYATKSPIVLTQSNGKLSSAEAKAIESAGYQRFVIVGGLAAVSPDVEGQLKSAGLKKAARLAGADRYATSKAIADWELKNGLSASKSAVATGANFPDALAGAALCGKNRSVILLAANPTSPALDFLASNRKSVSSGYILGGKAAVRASLAGWVNTATATGETFAQLNHKYLDDGVGMSGGATVYRLGVGTTYTTFDVTDDGKTDNLQIRGTATDQGTYTQAKIYVNGKCLLTTPASKYGAMGVYIDADLIHLQSGDCLLYVKYSSSNGYYAGSWVYRCASTRMTQLLATEGLVRDWSSTQSHAWHSYAALSAVSRNTLLVAVGDASGATGTTYAFEYSGGKLIGR